MGLTPEQIRERMNHRCDPPIKDRILGQAVWTAVNKYVNKGLPPQQAISHGYNWASKRSNKVTQRDIGKYFNQTTNEPNREDEAKTKPATKAKMRRKPPTAGQYTQSSTHEESDEPAVSSEEASDFFVSLMNCLEDDE